MPMCSPKWDRIGTKKRTLERHLSRWCDPR
jgi:hypothetical protein